MKTVENVKPKQEMKVKYKKFLKTRLTMVRGLGVFMSLFTLMMVLFQHFNIMVSPLFNSVSVLYLCGILFTIAAQYQDIRLAKKWARASRVISAFFFILTTVLLVFVLLDNFGVITL